MRPIYVNSRFLTQSQTGAQVFAGEISSRLKKILPSLIFISPKNVKNPTLAAELGCKTMGSTTGHLWEQTELPLYLKSKGSPLLVNLVNTAPLFYDNKVITVHDLSFLHYPKAVAARFSLYYNFLIPRILKNCRHVFTVSRFAKDDIAANCGVSADKITVTWNAVSEQYMFTNPGDRRRIILCVGSLQPLKNYGRVIEAFRKLKLKDAELVIAGGKNTRIFPKNYVLDNDGIQNNITFTGYKTAAELAVLYNSAQILVIPSLYETFGIPALEAMKCGCAVIASRRGGLPEVCDDAAYYVDPENVLDISEGISKMLNDADMRHEYIRKGLANAERFSWLASAEVFATVISRLSASNTSLKKQ